ncbi:MAG: tRNA (cytidine(34)-2'-O)-methyltransferase [Bdellovibrionales bacterium]|nr:tRNA (cytidine(34)-2'-O)-methyltransferase [Bdellovibrionales bacterium]
MDIVLVHPTIPWNTGNVGRTCVATNTHLHLVAPMGFELTDTQLKRAGLDYWPNLEYSVHKSLDAFEEKFSDRPKYLFSRFAKKSYWDVTFPADAMLIFGSEVSGLPDEYKNKYKENLLLIPMGGQVRSLNLSTSVGIVLFEALRQNRTL